MAFFPGRMEEAGPVSSRERFGVHASLRGITCLGDTERFKLTPTDRDLSGIEPISDTIACH